VVINRHADRMNDRPFLIPSGRYFNAEGHAHTPSDFRTPTLSIECERCGRFGRYTIARLMEKYGDARLPELLYILADCPKARAFSIHDRCKVVYGKDSRF
jgi:hypothetical protein